MLSANLLHFAIISMAFVAVPGPNIAIIVATSLGEGHRQGLKTVAGTSLAMAVQLLIAAFGTASLLAVLSEGLSLLKWMGVAYLGYLGFVSIKKFFNKDSFRAAPYLSSFKKGFVISLTNPKTILFFAAFLPQFTSGNENYFQQIALLSFSFWIIAIVIDSAYALLAASISSKFEKGNRTKITHGVSGMIYLAASALLAAKLKN